jgi:hypothetical protein
MEHGSWLVAKCHISCRVSKYRDERVFLLYVRDDYEHNCLQKTTAYAAERNAASTHMTLVGIRYKTRQIMVAEG